MTKEEIRKYILDKRNALSGKERSEASKTIAKKLYELEAFKSAANIFLYSSFGSEVDTKPITERLLSEGKAVALPRCTDDKNMVFHYIDSLDDLKSGYKRILEPDEKSPMALSEPDIIIVPGVAFDANMNRIGYGRGYYDRVFKAIPLYVPKIALAFDVQIADEIPYETLDETMDIIITQTRVYERDTDDFTI